MELNRRSVLVYGLLAAVLLLFSGWQGGEHYPFNNSSQTDLRNRSQKIANTLTLVLPYFRKMKNSARAPGRVFPRREGRADHPPPGVFRNVSGEADPPPLPPPDHETHRHDGPGEGTSRSRPPFWLRNMPS